MSDESWPQPSALRFCNHCARSPKDGSKLMKCTGCVDAPTYCSKACQKAHWPTHKVFCKSESSNKHLLENAPCAAPKLLLGFDSLEELTRTFNDYTGADRWALQTVVIIYNLLRSAFGRIPQPNNIVLRFWSARTTSEPSRNPARTFTFTRVSWHEATHPKQLSEFAVIRTSSLAVHRDLFSNHERPPDSTILALFALEGDVHSALECFPWFLRRPEGITRVVEERMKAPLEDLARMCIASLNTQFPIHSVPTEGRQRLPAPGRYVRENKNWVWQPLFTTWEDYLAGDTDCGPLVALEGLTSGLPPHHLRSLFFSI